MAAKGSTGKRVMPRGRPFAKGQSGNPGGQPKSAKLVRELLREKSNNGQIFVDGLVKAAKKGNVHACVKGLEMLLPKEISGPEGGPIPIQTANLKALSDEQLTELGKIIAAAAAGDDPPPDAG